MSTISNISSNLLNLLSSDSSKNSSTSDSSSSNTVSSSKTDDLTSSNLDTYVSMLQSSHATLADYMGDSSSDSSSGSLYSVLNYNASGKVQNIIQQLTAKEEAANSSSSTSNTNKVSSN